MKTISIDSGFRRGGSLLQWDGENFVAKRTAYECTWEGDEDTSFTLEVPEGFKGAVVKFYTDADRVYSAELIGFTAEELQQPSPIMGWMVISIGCRAVRSTLLECHGWYLIARALNNRQIITAESVMVTGEKHKSGNGMVLAKLPCECGDQVSAHYVLFGKDGCILDEKRDCGDNTPIPVMTDTGWEFTSLNEENNYWRVARNRAESSSWADVADCICSAYKQGINSLPGLRKQYRGKWEYHKNGVPAYSRATVIFSEAEFPWEKSWAVTYTADEVPRHELPRLTVPPINSMAKVLEAVLV